MRNSKNIRARINRKWNSVEISGKNITESQPSRNKWNKFSQDEFEIEKGESNKRPRRCSGEDCSRVSPSKNREPSFENKRKKTEKDVTRGSPAMDSSKKGSKNFRDVNLNSDFETSPRKTSSMRNEKSPIVPIAEKVKLRKRTRPIDGDYNYSKVSDLNSKNKYCKKKLRKKETLISPRALNPAKDSELQKNMKKESLLKKFSKEQAKESKKDDGKIFYSKKVKSLGIRKKFSRPKMVSSQKKIKPGTVSKKTPAVPSPAGYKKSNGTSEKKNVSNSLADLKPPVKCEANKCRKKSSKWSLGMLPQKKKANRNVQGSPLDDKKSSTNELFVSVRNSMIQRNALLKKINAEAALPVRKESFNDHDDKNCYDRPEIMTLLLNLTRTINKMSGLDKLAQFKKQRTRKPKTSIVRLKNNNVAAKPDDSESVKETGGMLLATTIENALKYCDSNPINIRNTEKKNGAPDSSNAVDTLTKTNVSSSSSSILFEDAEKDLEMFSLSVASNLVSDRADETNSLSKEASVPGPEKFPETTELTRSPNKNLETMFCRDKHPLIKRSSKSPLKTYAAKQRPNDRSEGTEKSSSFDMLKKVLSPDSFFDTSIDLPKGPEENIEINLPLSGGRGSPEITLETGNPLPDRPDKSNVNKATEPAKAFDDPRAFTEGEKSDGEECEAGEERAKQLSLVKIVEMPERNDEDDKDTVIFNLSNLPRSTPVKASKFTTNKGKSSAKVKKTSRWKIKRLRRKRKEFYESKKVKRKAKFKRTALNKKNSAASTNLTEVAQNSENSTHSKDPDFLNTVKEVSSLIKKLHESHQIILFLEKDMASKPELANHFKPVISAQYSNYQKYISKNKAIILKGFDKMKETLSEPSLVTTEISKEALLSEEEVGNVISRCILEEDVPEQIRNDSRDDSEGGNAADATAVRSVSADVSTSPCSSQENQPAPVCVPEVCHSGLGPAGSLELSASIASPALGFEQPRAVATVSKDHSYYFDSNERVARQNLTPPRNVLPRDFSKSDLPFPSLSNGVCRKVPILRSYRKEKSTPNKTLASKNHPYKIVMTKTGLCLRLEEKIDGPVLSPNSTAPSTARKVVFSAPSSIKNMLSGGTKVNETGSTSENSKRLPESETDVSVNRISSINNSRLKEPSEFLQGFVKEFVGPLRHSVIIPGPKTSAEVSDKQGTDNVCSVLSRFSELPRTNQTLAMETSPAARKLGTNRQARGFAPMKSHSKNSDLPIVEAGNVLKSALLKAARGIGTKVPEKSHFPEFEPEVGNLSSSKDFGRVNSLVVMRVTDVADPRIEERELQSSVSVSRSVFRSEKKPGSPNSKNLNESLSRTSPDTQKKAMAQLIELSKKLVESRSLLRRSGGATRPGTTAALDEKTLQPRALTNGNAAEFRPETPSTSRSKKLTGNDPLLKGDASPLFEDRASASVALRRSKRIQTNKIPSELSVSNLFGVVKNEPESGEEKETRRKEPSSRQAAVAFVKTEKELTRENEISATNFPHREESSSGENQSDDDSSDVYFDLDKVKKELEDEHGLIHFICAENKCMNPGTEICTGCQSVLYCSRNCQARHWNRKHYKHCENLKKESDGRKKNKIAEIKNL